MAEKLIKEVHWGIIGAGDVCEVKSGPALQQANNSKLVAIMRRDGEKAKDFALRHQVPKWYDDADELINDPDVNAIYIATPPNVHKEYTLKAAAAGKPVYVEKPMARNYNECISMIKECQKANVKLFVAYYRRALPNILKVKEIVENGFIGKIQCVNIKLHKAMNPKSIDMIQENNWRVNPDISGGGYFYDLASHQFDALDYILGPINKAQGFAVNQGSNYSAEDLIVGSYSFKNGILGSGVWAFNTGYSAEVEITTIIGSEGQVSFSFFGDNSVSLEVDGKSKEIFQFEISRHIQQNLIQEVVDDLLGKGKCSSTGVSGARTNWVLENICNRIND